MSDRLRTYLSACLQVEITIRLLRKAMAASGGCKFLIDGFPRDMPSLDGWHRIVGVEVRGRWGSTRGQWWSRCLWQEQAGRVETHLLCLVPALLVRSCRWKCRVCCCTSAPRR